MNHAHKSGVWRWLKGVMLRKIHGMINCKEFEEFVLGYLDGEISSRQRSVFERHMRICRECRDYLAAYQRAIEVGRSALASSPDDPLPAEVPEDLINAILDARSN